MTNKIAITGMAFRFPESEQGSFWQDLLDGLDLVTQVDVTRWSQPPFLHPRKQHPGSTQTFAAGSIGDVSGFDAAFFGISPREAAQMDPQQRILLELAWETMENAGVRPASLRGSDTGVYIGLASADYSYRLADDLAVIDASTATGNTASIAANRISFMFDLHGPSMAIDTACSSALVAFHQACRAIQAGDCATALAGAISLHLHPFGFLGFSKASMLSPSGRCHTFDADGDGYVRSEGGGMFMLKAYDQAIADGDPILAVVAASAVNTDGRKSGLTVPNAKAQSALLTQVYQQAGIEPGEIDYLEAHGTGTAVGDPIETHAIGAALGKRRAPGKPLWIGSVKSNLGHLETASGAAGLVKALYCLQHRMAPATIGIRQINPNIALDELNLDVVTENRPLPARGQLIVGVNSFGFGGANAHVILTSHEAEQSPPNIPARPLQPPTNPLPFLISGKTSDALRAAAKQWADWLPGASSALSAIAYASLFRRDWHEQRAVFFASDVRQLASQLQLFSEQPASAAEVATGAALESPAGPVFVFSGNGSQWEGMGKALLADPVFLAAVREVDGCFQPLAGFSLEAKLAGQGGGLHRYEHTEIAQPALFAVQVGITRMLRAAGVEPVAVVGHSVGEVAAAWACGALDLAAAVRVIHYRSHAQGKTKGLGRMTAVGMSEDETRLLLESLPGRLPECLHIAGSNSARGVTVAGDAAALGQLEAALDALGVFQRRLDLDYAFHSPAMDAIEDDIRAGLSGIEARAGEIPFYSTVTGAACETSQLDAEYWWHNVRQPVRFKSALDHLQHDLGANLFIEIGPHPVLRGYLADALKDADIAGRILATARRNDDSPANIRRVVGECLLAGGRIDWPRYFPQPEPHAALPNYPWQRERHWHPVTAESIGSLTRHSVHPLLGYPLPQHVLTWENQLDTALFPSLADHVVGTAVVFPGAGFAELALAAARQWQQSDNRHAGDNVIEIEDLEIHTPLLLGQEHTKLVRVSLDAADGRLQVQAREYAKQEPWTRHAVARIRPQPAGLFARQEAWGGAAMPPKRAADFTAAEHLRHTHAAGLNYGPAFQCIRHGWIENDTVWAALALPQPVPTDLARTLLHPALLDCAFQLIVELLHGDAAWQPGIAFVPVRLGRLNLRLDAGSPTWVRARLNRRNPHSLSAAFTFHDENGEIIAEVREARFRGVRLHKTASERLSYLDEHLVPSPLAATSHTAVVDYALVHGVLAEALDPQCAPASLRRYGAELEPLLDALGGRFVREAFASVADTAGRLQLASSPRVAYLLRMAEEEGVVLRDDAGDWSLAVEEANQVSASAIWKTLLADYPDHFAITLALGRAGLHLPSVLRGEVLANPVSANPADPATPRSADLAQLMEAMLSPQTRQFIGQGLRQLLARLFAELPAGQRLRVLHLSTAASTFTQDICAALDFDRGDYVFASPSDAAVEAARPLRERYPLIETRLLESGLQAEVCCEDHFALALVQLDSLDQVGLDACLRHARQSLCANGSLIVLGSHPARWLEFLSVATSDATSVATHAPLLSAQAWQARLASLGFVDAALLDPAAGTFAGPFLLTARCPACRDPICSTKAARSWLLLADDDANAAPLAAALTAAGDQVMCAPIQTEAELVQYLNAGVNGKKPDGIVFLAGIGNSHGGGTGEDAVHLLDRQTASCAHAATLLRACEAAQNAAPCWIVTRDAADAGVLRGFARAMQNEMTPGRLRLVDLADDISATPGNTAQIQALLAEFNQVDGESEVHLSANGLRFATRIRQFDASKLPFPSGGGGMYAISSAPAHFPLPFKGGGGEGMGGGSAASAPAPIPHLTSPLKGEGLDKLALVGAGGEGKGYGARLSSSGADISMPVSAAAQIQAEDATIRLGFEAPGQLRNLRWEAHAPVQPGEDEIEVEVKASGLNFRDVMYAQGLLSDEAIENGFAGATLGLEFAGIVLRTGSRVQHYAAGDAVLGFGPASFANRVITKDSALTHLPAGISFEAAATIPTVFFTVYYALHHLARLAAGEKILIHGAAGGVGIAAIQFAQWIGAEIHATAGSEAKRDFLRLLGVDYIYDSRSLDFADQVLANTQGQGVDVVLNSLAGEAIRRNFDVLKPFGRFLELGKRDFYENTHIGLRPFRNNISYFGIDADQLMQANPALTRKLFTEMMALFAQGEFYPLPYQVFEADQVVDAFRFMQQARQIGKVVVTYRNGFGDVLPARPQALSTLSLSSDATYLVTGGLAGFGLSTAEWLAEKGARHLVLISRRGPVFSNPGDEARAALDRLVASGVAVHAAAVDVTDAQAVARLLEHVRANMPPVKGIVHAAAVIEDALVRNLDADKIRKVLAPKIQGALNLHAATQDLPLDFFVMFSSATTLFGNPGQSAYIAANSFLEGFAEMRRKAGLPATCVRWGPIDDVGFLARNSQIKEALQSRMGGSAVSAATAMNVLEKMLLADQSGLAVMELDWRALSRFLPAAQAQKYRELAAHAPQDEYQAEAVDDIRQMLAGLQGAALHGAVINLLKREVAEILRLAPEKIDVNRSLYDIGMDSLMGMELMLALENSFGVHLPVMALAESPTLTRLTERVVETLQGEGSAGNEAADQIAQLAAQHGVAADQAAIGELAESMRDADPNSVIPAQAGIQLVGLTFMNPERRPG